MNGGTKAQPIDFADYIALKPSNGSMVLLVGRCGATRTRLLRNAHSSEDVAPKADDRNV
jgi:hypothetical protein